ncbi:hypothetical protein ACEV8T_22995, partial [Vibrio parahaemolyticus]
MGARTGLEILAASRRRKCSTPIILLTGWAAADIDQAASEAGAADFLEKSRLDEVTLDRSIR